MKKSATDSFVLTMPFRYEPWQRDCLDKAFRIAGGIYNSLVANRKKALEQLEKTKAWRANQRALRAAYETEGSGSKSELKDGFIQRQLEDGFEQFLQHHAQEIERLSHMQTPCSTGVRCQAA